MANNPNTPQTPKKSFFRKALDAVLGSDSDSLAEMKRLNKKAEDEGEFNPKTIEEKRAYEELLKKEEATKKKKRQDAMSTATDARGGAKSALGSVLGRGNKKKDEEETKELMEPDTADETFKGGLATLLEILAEPGNAELKENIYSICGLIALIRNHRLMQAKGRGGKFKSILTQKGYDLENLLMLLQATFKEITDVTIPRNVIDSWINDDKLKATNILYNKALKSGEKTPKTKVRRKLLSINPTIDQAPNAWIELNELLDALNYWYENPNTNSTEIMESFEIEEGIPGEVKLAEKFINESLGTAPIKRKAKVEAGPEPQPEVDDSHEIEAPAPETSKILDIGKVREMATGEIARSIELLDTFKLEINKKAEDAVFATGSSPLKSDDEVINAIEDCEVGGDNPLDGFGEALIDSSKDIGGGERKITKDILQIIADWKGIKNEMELIMQIPEVAKHLKDIFPQL